ncbi:vacuolar protein sorting-associated protein 45 [Tieghemiomyces parasiticus]|uniref:Vacuolar protein sorting-associated protein 45 n=1 Tax=Tieghemiomyces parasiticus TaxID=78921 RepID=A0A9W7ZYS4_9FUNG|nr:vacuolar protein sorting-associated protein 45 [Tieghemiomyces parasiticus]
MDVIQAVQVYLNKMVTDVSGMKVLLMDKETTSITSAAITQSSLLAKETFLVDRLEHEQRDVMMHLKCLCYLRPTEASIGRLVDELRNPKYREYYLFFSHVLKKSVIEQLAEADEHELVREVQEFYADYLAVDQGLFSLNMRPQTYPLYSENIHTWNPAALTRAVQGVTSVLLSLKRRPIVRFQANSPMTKKLGKEINHFLQTESTLFNARQADPPPTLLILDRRNDPVTPLLNQWTYQAMVHELLGIDNGRVDLTGVPDVRKDLTEVVLAVDQDTFYRKSLYLNFGDLGESIKRYVEEYQRQTQSTVKIDSIADMKRFVENYPEFRKLSGNVTKHVTVVGELSRRVEQQALLAQSELEQSLACNEAHATDLQNLRDMLLNPKITNLGKLRLVCLYALRYELYPNNATEELTAALVKAGVDGRIARVVPNLLRYAGNAQRQGDLFQNRDLLSRGRHVIRGLQGVENVYTQHTPHLGEILDSLAKSKPRSDQDYPFVEPAMAREGPRPREVIIFMVGGATYAESRLVAQLNASQTGTRYLLGGTIIHNAESFVEELVYAFASQPMASLH